MEGREFRDLISDFEAANTAILGASYDTVAENLRFAETNEFPYPLLSDPDRTLAPYGAGEAGNAKRIGVIINGEGVVTWSGKASVQGFAAEALAHVQG